jgi:WhiB family redox-sensing transcriptional regulator
VNTPAAAAKALRDQATADLLSVAAWSAPQLADLVAVDRRPCASAPELFFPAGTDAGLTAQARQVCAACPARAACLALAMSQTTTPDGETELFGGVGIWGGATEQERRDLVGTWRTLCRFAGPAVRQAVA